MRNELAHRNWWHRNWKWLLPASLLIGFIASISAILDGNVTDFAQAYQDAEVVQNAILKANENNNVQNALGTLKQIDKLAILEGNAVYSDDGKTIKITVRVSGEKGNGKIDIVAKKSLNQWAYETIQIRPKSSKEKIQVLAKE